MRDLKEVINQIMRLIDSEDNENDYVVLYIVLDKILEKIKYKAPELIIKENWWNIVYSILDKYVIPPKKEIDYKILSIWTMRSIEKN